MPPQGPAAEMKELATLLKDFAKKIIKPVWSRLCELLNVERRLSTAYHPQTDGSAERRNQEVESYLRSPSLSVAPLTPALLVSVAPPCCSVASPSCSVALLRRLDPVAPTPKGQREGIVIARNKHILAELANQGDKPDRQQEKID